MANQQGEAGEQRAGRNGFHHPNLSIKAQERAGKKEGQLTALECAAPVYCVFQHATFM